MLINATIKLGEDKTESSGIISRGLLNKWCS
jgi:hypothetical protein